jgi:putative transposase
MIRIQLDTTTRDELQAMRHQDLPAKSLDRLEMVLLADAGWPAARIAVHLGYNYRTALYVLKEFLARGRDALFPRRTGRAPDPARRDHVASQIRDLLVEDRSWTSAQLAEALQPKGISLSDRQVRRHLRGLESPVIDAPPARSSRSKTPPRPGGPAWSSFTSRPSQP